jgi:hypothetical protein
MAIGRKQQTRTIHGSADDGDLTVLTTSSSLLQKVGLGATPTDFGLPDLLAEGLSPDEQDARLKQLVETQLFVYKDGRRVSIVMIGPMLQFISDLFFERTQQAILWKPRGGGGSLAAAILIWLMMVYRARSFLDMAGSGEQAKRVYEYTTQFWYCVPGLAEALLDGDPLLSETRLKNGVTLSCVPASEKAARGKHVAGFVADESCQEDARVGRVLQAALQGVLSEPNYVIVLLSTFHVPFGFFQESWDQAEERGYRQYRWNVYDCMVQCTVGLDEATDDDPQAQGYCRRECPLTEVATERDAEGRVVGEYYTGCDGRARTSSGHLPRDAVIKAKMVNAGTGVWEVEHECQRPTTAGMVYDPVKVQAAVVPLESLQGPSGRIRRALGVDWGTHAVAVLAERHGPYVAIREGRVFDGESMAEVIKYAVQLRATHGNFRVYPDAENKYGNLDLISAGFEVQPVAFGQMKEAGIENVTRFLNHGRLKIADHGDLKIVIRQMMRLHRNDLGKVVKKDDHGPDALLCAMLHFRFEDEFESAIDQMYADGQQERRRLTNAVLEACIHDEGPARTGPGSSMGVSVGSADYYVVVSALPADVGGVRRALFVGRAQTFDELDRLRAKYEVRLCVVDAQADPHRVDEWARRGATGAVVRAEYLNDGISRPEWDYGKATVSVDRTYLLDAAHDEIRGGTWWLMSGAQDIDDGEFFAQMKAPKRERDLTAGVLRYRWTESGGVEHYRHAQAFDHLAAGLLIRNRVTVSRF